MFTFSYCKILNDIYDSMFLLNSATLNTAKSTLGRECILDFMKKYVVY
jgi:hypothetical protein